MRRTVAIIGGGFCGTLTAVHLLRTAPPEIQLRIVLINQSGSMARGLAYGTHSDLHVLNVPAGNMSALPDEPEHFLRYCRRFQPSTSPADFMARSTYGAYLETLLSEEEQRSAPQARLERRVDTVLKLAPTEGGTQLWLQNGKTLLADQVVLAFGHFPPADPAAINKQVRASGRYVRDPWAPEALLAIQPDESVAVLGSGLTALDVLIALRQCGHQGATFCLSRRGLRPVMHKAGASQVALPDAEAVLSPLKAGARSALRALRESVEQAAGNGRDWRDILASLRSHTSSIWHAWPQMERRRFLRHLQAYWDVHRHRCAPLPGPLLELLETSVHAGRLTHIDQCAQGLRLHWRARGGQQVKTREVAWLINCTGPDCRLRHADSPLIDGLLKRGVLCPDELELGLRVAKDYACIDIEGRASPTLRYVGPLLKARDWEATAVPELRVHARDAAAHILHALTLKADHWA
ncbi:FAD/NAD(P)-binding protein [Pseudomonas citronellolis]|uniref:FAD/NAD(P)-binding protein n=1 Tax=Pseudomonas citronellolis TaxID=53408 RepID=UPI0021C2143E|nr:FAD/NAD(P)-binding protein [Pseudomonas citronellolis]UXJ50300.1 FAD/NAD(P)-binding protein [Pseudomonas citronellolis]